MATRQLLLISSDYPGWKLDERTRAVGRAGVARARMALATRPADQPAPATPAAA
jgi:hypothetical protein